MPLPKTKKKNVSKNSYEAKLGMAYKLHEVVKVLNRKGLPGLFGLAGQRLLDNESDGRVVIRIRLSVEELAHVSHCIEKSKRSNAVQAK